MSSAARPPFERAATPPVAQSRVAGKGKVESSPLQTYLIFVMNAVRVNFLAECKKIPGKTRKLLFWANLS